MDSGLKAYIFVVTRLVALSDLRDLLAMIHLSQRYLQALLEGWTAWRVQCSCLKLYHESLYRRSSL